MSTGEIARHVNPHIRGIMFGLGLSPDDKHAVTYTNNSEIIKMNLLTGEHHGFIETEISEQMAIRGIHVCAREFINAETQN